MDENEKDWLSCIGLVLYIPLFSAAGIIVNGWIVSLFWKWFIVPIFPVQPLTILQAYGIALLIGLLTKHEIDVKAPKRTTMEIVLRGISTVIVSPLITLGFGWIVFQFMK